MEFSIFVIDGETEVNKNNFSKGKVAYTGQKSRSCDAKAQTKALLLTHIGVKHESHESRGDKPGGWTPGQIFLFSFP